MRGKLGPRSSIKAAYESLLLNSKHSEREKYWAILQQQGRAPADRTLHPRCDISVRQLMDVIGAPKLQKYAAPRLPSALRRRLLELVMAVPWKELARLRAQAPEDHRKNSGRRSAAMSAQAVVLGAMYIPNGPCRCVRDARLKTILRVPGALRFKKGAEEVLVACATLWHTLRALLRAVDPAFRFTSVIVNRKFAPYAAHVDKNNTRSQYVLGLDAGGYEAGGDLWTLTERPGEIVAIRTRNGITAHEGRRCHFVTKYNRGGQRISIVPYSVDTKDEEPLRPNLPRRGLGLKAPLTPDRTASILRKSYAYESWARRNASKLLRKDMSCASANPY